MPASIIRGSTSGSREAGPIVATILVRRSMGVRKLAVRGPRRTPGRVAGSYGPRRKPARPGEQSARTRPADRPAEAVLAVDPQAHLQAVQRGSAHHVGRRTDVLRGALAVPDDACARVLARGDRPVRDAAAARQPLERRAR